MKVSLTIEQSAELIRLGVSVDKASGDYHLNPVFTIGDMLSILPKSIRLGDFGIVYELDISWYEMYGYWRVTYGGLADCRATEVIYAMYGSLIQLIKCKQLKPEEL